MRTARAPARATDPEARQILLPDDGLPDPGSRPVNADDDRNALALLALAAGEIGAYQLDLLTGQVRLDERATVLLTGTTAPAHLSLRQALAEVHRLDRRRLVEAVAGAVEGADEYELEIRAPMPEGHERWLATRGNVVRDPQGNASSVVGVVHETSRDDLHRAAMLLEVVPTAFFSLSRRWHFTFVNTEAEQLLGRSRDELVGGDLWELCPAAVGTAFERHYRHAMTSGEPVSFDEYYPAPLDAWYEVRAFATPEGLSVYFLDVTSRRRLQEQTERVARNAALVSSITTALASTLDAEEAVAALARRLVPQLGDWCVVTLADVDEGGMIRDLRDVGWWHSDPQHLGTVREYASNRQAALDDASFLFRSLASGDLISVPEGATERIHALLRPGRAQELIEELAPRSVTVLPLRGRGRTLGALSLFNGDGRPPLAGEDLATVQDIAARAGLALDNAYLYARQRSVAEELQRSFLTAPPRPEHLDVAVRYLPASQSAKVGGDWYDAFTHPDGRMVVVIGDVAGHDLEAAAFMGQIRSILRGIAVTSSDGPAGIITQVDRAITTLTPGAAATAIVMTLEPQADGRTLVRWSNAGHPPPMHVTSRCAVTPLAGSNMLLGILPGTQRVDREIVLDPGGTLVLYTDGLVERRRNGGLKAGLDDLAHTLADLAETPELETLCDELLRRLVPSFAEDDVAIVAVRPVTAPTAAPSAAPADLAHQG